MWETFYHISKIDLIVLFETVFHPKLASITIKPTLRQTERPIKHCRNKQNWWSLQNCKYTAPLFHDSLLCMENFVTRTTAIVTRTITIVIQEIFPPTPQLPHFFSLLFRRAQKIPVLKGVNSLIQNLRKLDQHIRKWKLYLMLKVIFVYLRDHSFKICVRTKLIIP